MLVDKVFRVDAKLRIQWSKCLREDIAMEPISHLELLSVTGEHVILPPSEGLVHLQFRRFAGCPICNLHLQSIVHRHDEIEAAGIREVVFFHSPAEELAKYTADLPFATVADSDKRYYRQFGVESSPRALLHPRAWAAAIRGTALTVLGRFRAPTVHQTGGHLGLPADFLIDSNGTVIAEKRGTHAYDQWSVDELLAHARAARPAS
jgi:peroxiredoxin